MRRNNIKIPRGAMDRRVTLMAQASAREIPSIRTTKRVNVTIEPEKLEAPKPVEEIPIVCPSRGDAFGVVATMHENDRLRAENAMLRRRLKALEIRTGVSS